MKPLSEELQQMLHPLVENNFLKEYRYQVANLSEFELSFRNLESEFLRLYSQILSLEEKIFLKKNE